MTEGDARDLLRRFEGVGGFEAWIADQPWRVVPLGWLVIGDLRGTQFMVENGPDHLRVHAWIEGGGPAAEWIVQQAAHDEARGQ
jgi:hypothetical protein